MAQPPIDKIRIGNLTATIWQNFDAQGQPFYVCTFSRSYTDAEGNWHDAPTFGRGDLLRLAKLSYQADSRIESLVQENRGNTNQDEANQQRSVAGTNAQTHQR